MESINSFVSGMNSDVSSQIHTPDSYLQALNFRGITSLGGSNGSLVNIKGNDLAITFPELRNVYKLIIDPVLTGDKSTSGIVTITINGSTTAPINVSAGSVGLDIYNALKNLPNCFESTGVASTPEFAVSYLDNYVVVYQQPVYTLTTTTLPNLLITITLSNPTTATTTISFVDFANVTSNTQSVYLTGTSNLILIGSGYIDDNIYLLTAANDDTENNPHPNDSFSNLGTIWKLKIDEITKESTLTLIYNNNLDFTKYHPVPPTAILGRYESNGIQRLYWSDYYNAIRTIVVSDPQLMALDPTQISVFPAVSFEIPLLESFPVGSLTRGSYELCYKLKKTTGAISNFSQTSNIVSLQGNEEDVSGGGFNNYECDGSITSSGRGIKWNVWNIDTSWDTIEFFVLYRGSKTDLPIIYKVPSETIPSASPYLFEFLTTEELDTISIEEYLSLSSGFTHAKTCETKDNILFWGNTKLVKQKQISDVFDARAFRAHSPNTIPGSDDDIILKNNGVIATYNLNEATATPYNNDSINQYYTSTGDNDTVNECYYKPGTSVLGGAGKYISYEFVTENILLSDLSPTASVGGDWFFNTVSAGGPPYSYKAVGGISATPNPLDLIQGSTDSDNQTYPIVGLGTAKNPYFTSTLKGFQQEEIYRFGIQFFDLQGVPYFTEWIGDIKMPSYGDTCNNLTDLELLADPPFNDFRNTFFIPNGLYGRTLGVKFTVDVTAVANLISGYQIVRVERDKRNRTMLGYGMLTNAYKDYVNSAANIGGGMHRDSLVYFDNALTVTQFGRPYSPWPNQDSIEAFGQVDGTSNNDLSVSNRMLTFDCFDYMTGEFSHQAGDKMLVRSKVFPINFKSLYTVSTLHRYRTGFYQLDDYLTNSAVTNTQPSLINPVFSGGRFKTGYDAEESPVFILFYIDEETYGRNRSDVNKVISKGIYCGAGSSLTAAETGVVDFNNHMMSYGPYGDGSQPGQGATTMLTTFDSANQISSRYFAANDTNGKKLMALYYRPNAKQYGGNTYSSRSNNEYIACGSFIPLVRKNNLLINNKVVTTKVFGGDVFINNWDLQKMMKDPNGSEYNHYNNSPPSNSSVGSVTGVPMVSDQMRMANMFYIPCTNVNNQAVRGGSHFDRVLNSDPLNPATQSQWYYPGAIDGYVYDSFHSNEKTTTKFIPKPVEFIINDEWRNRIYFSNPKYDNETSDSWSAYPINQFYDVEGNYGGITSLISLNQTVYFIQERGFGMLMINPVSMVSDTTTGAPIKLGSSTTVIQKHFYKALDIGSKHQWSVYRSQNSIAFTDTRQKKIFIFNGESLKPISDVKGQRNFMFKRLHDNILNHDNPVIGKGLLTTFDYQNSEFLFTFKNNGTIGNPSKDENYTISFSEYLDAFVSMYSFTPNIYVNNNTNLLSVINNNPKKLYLHNNGEYSKFYGTVYPSTLKFIVNNNPTYTKVFDNLVISTEAVNDNIQWSDDLNIYPGAISLPTYPDNINIKDSTFDKARFYNQYQNTDWVTLNPAVGGTIRKVEQGFNLQIPRNKFNYDLYPVSTSSLFDPSKLTKTSFGDRLRDKWVNIDLSYNNLLGLRFIVHNVKTLFRVSDR